jgi:glycosyltransferase involved in cell wall biosynthesis
MCNIPAEHQYEISLINSDNQYLSEKKDLFKKANILPDREFKGKYTLKKINYSINKYYSKRSIQKNNFDLFHPTFYDTYFLDVLKKPYVITVHDLIAFKFKDLLNHFNAIRPKMKEAIENANRIIAVSENTKSDIINVFNIKPDKIDVIYHGFNLPVNSTAKNEHGDYILFVGRRESYKNFGTFVHAISGLLASNKHLKLICVGKPFDKEEIADFTRLNIADKVKAINVDEAGLNSLYTNAKLFVYPSLYEGFGMPILEAFANNCPICLSDTGCFPEIAGNAGIYFNPSNQGSILDAVEKVLNDDHLKTNIIREGKERLTNFSWKKAAAETIKTYQKVI